ncbi:cytochrome P450 4C1-like [Temnothorax curvispinosus]|uniref:Cytochrome P450 4C1-like n=1 Tax=Temnothorax curvispinosus TaxID=300111 RepID=A0A6J1QHR3_9HYME|nr:cytochrome P450 4C1-like [Temnothorax curvispinosus]
MGYKLNAQKNYNDEYVKAVDRVASIVQMRFTNVWISSDSIFKLTTVGKEHDHLIRVIQKLVDKVIFSGACRDRAWQDTLGGLPLPPRGDDRIKTDRSSVGFELGSQALH